LKKWTDKIKYRKTNKQTLLLPQPSQVPKGCVQDQQRSLLARCKNFWTYNSNRWKKTVDVKAIERTYKQKDRQKDRQTERQTERHTDRMTN
jgi:hypothetical protein